MLKNKRYKEPPAGLSGRKNIDEKKSGRFEIQRLTVEKENTYNTKPSLVGGGGGGAAFIKINLFFYISSVEEF